ncbi:hypothetical protein STEG23_022219, partial [Scotinomys teguina]
TGPKHIVLPSQTTKQNVFFHLKRINENSHFKKPFTSETKKWPASIAYSKTWKLWLPGSQIFRARKDLGDYMQLSAVTLQMKTLKQGGMVLFEHSSRTS